MNEANKLLEKYKAGKCTSEEQMLLRKWFHHLGEDETSELTEEDLIAARRSFEKNVAGLTGGWQRTWMPMLAAAAVLVVISAGIYFYTNYFNGSEETYANVDGQTDITPGGNKAVLILADGSRISLTDAKNGELAEQSGMKITKAEDGQLIYTVSNSGNSSQPISYNTIETPAGGQYRVNLPDGSKVWLNSASSLRYPVRFIGNERKVQITGEAYFEVASDKTMPFKVVSNDQTVEVLGTHFNVMAYPDESSTNTTLLEGSVKIVKENKSKVISPGQQAKIQNGNIDVVAVDTEEVTAWKNGYFIFKSEDIQSIMRQICRWYNTEVEYRGDISGKVFGGKISRSRNISDVLEILESTGSLHFTIVNGNAPGQERRIVVMP